MAGHEILEQRTRVGKNVTGQQTYEEVMDGCGRPATDRSGQAEWVCERLDETWRMHVCQYRPRHT